LKEASAARAAMAMGGDDARWAARAENRQRRRSGRLGGLPDLFTFRLNVADDSLLTFWSGHCRQLAEPSPTMKTHVHLSDFPAQLQIIKDELRQQQALSLAIDHPCIREANIKLLSNGLRTFLSLEKQRRVEVATANRQTS